MLTRWSRTETRLRRRQGFYWTNDEQKRLILASKEACRRALGRKITTEVASDYDKYGGVFYYAEDYHRASAAMPRPLPRPSLSWTYSVLTRCPIDGFALDAEQYLAKPGARVLSARPRCVAATLRELGAKELHEKHTPKLDEGFWRVHGPKPHCVIRSPNQPIETGSW